MPDSIQLDSIVLGNGAEVSTEDVLLIRNTLEEEDFANEIPAGTVAEITEIHFGNESAGFLAVYTEEHGFFRAHGLTELLEEEKIAIGRR